MEFDDVPGYADKIAQFQRQDRLIKNLFFTAPDITDSDWHQIVEKCFTGSDDLLLKDMFKKHGLPWEEFDTFHDDVDENCSFNFIQARDCFLRLL